MKQTLEKFADKGIEQMEKELGIFVVKQKPVIKENLIFLLQTVRRLTIRECMDKLEDDSDYWYAASLLNNLDKNTINI